MLVIANFSDMLTSLSESEVLSPPIKALYPTLD
jgi:hypothetical protein